MSIPSSPRSVLLPLLRRAGEILRTAHSPESENAVLAKEGTANFVTLYDVRTQEFLMREIAKLYPDAQFIAEEQENDSSVLSAPCCFVIDPIDGTTNFIHDYKHSCISLAMLSGGEVVFGAIYDPYLDEMFSAERGKGAELNGIPMHVSERPLELGVAAFGTSPYRKDLYTEPTFALAHELYITCTDLRRCGSAALDMAYVAAGRNDLFFECMLSPWDYAAGMLLITEAGGIISDMTGAPLELTSTRSVMAANKEIYPAFLAMTRPYAEMMGEKAD